MSWWDTSSFSALAANAIKTAQKKIDKVLDIKDEAQVEGTSMGATKSSSPWVRGIDAPEQTPQVFRDPKSTSSAVSPADSFWDTWLSPSQHPSAGEKTAIGKQVTGEQTATVASPGARKSKASTILPSRSTKLSKVTLEQVTGATVGARQVDKGDSVLLANKEEPQPDAAVAAGDRYANLVQHARDEEPLLDPSFAVNERSASSIGDHRSGHVPETGSLTAALIDTEAEPRRDSSAHAPAVNVLVPSLGDSGDENAKMVEAESDVLKLESGSRLADEDKEKDAAVQLSSPVEEVDRLHAPAGDNLTAASLKAITLHLDCGSAAHSMDHAVTQDEISRASPITLPDAIFGICEPGAGQEKRSEREHVHDAESGEKTNVSLTVAAAVPCLQTGLELDASKSEISSSSTTSLATVADAFGDDSVNADSITENHSAEVATRGAACLLEESIDDMIIVDHETQPKLHSLPSDAALTPDSCQISERVVPFADTDRRSSAVEEAENADYVLDQAVWESGPSGESARCDAADDATDEGEREADIDEAAAASFDRRSAAGDMVCCDGAALLDDQQRTSGAHSRNSSVDVSNSSRSGALSDRNGAADELLDFETGTSSDIEIISMSTHSESNGDARLVDFMPSGTLTRSIFKTKMRELSPEASSESGSNGSQASPPCVRGCTPDPLLLMDADSAFQPALKRDATDDPLDSQTLLKKLSHLAEVLEARESKILTISKENADLLDLNGYLKGKIEALEEGNVAVENLKEEFGQRLSEMERRLQLAAREKEMLKKQMTTAQEELSARHGSSQTMESMLREKDEQITCLLQEGEKLSKQQLQSNNIIKKLRAKDKENDELLRSQREKLDTQKKEIERLQVVLDSKIDNEKQHSDTIKQLNTAAKKYQDDNARLKAEAEDHQEKIRSMQSALDSSYKEIAELLKASASKESRVQELALSAELQAKEELRAALEKLQRESVRDTHALAVQVEDLQLAMARAEKDHARREAALREDVADLQQRLQEADARSGDVTRNIALSTRPLLRQIENLQSAHSAQSESWEKLERNLTERLAEAQSQLAGLAERERAANDRAIEAAGKVSALESQCGLLKQERVRLVADIDALKTRIELLEEDKASTAAQYTSLRQNFEKELNELRKEKVLVENQLEMEKVRADHERKKALLLQEQLKEKEQQLSQLPSPALRGSPAPSTATPSRESAPLIYKQEDLLERALQTPLLFGGSAGGSLYESMRQSGATALIENLEAQLKCREGEVLQLQRDLTEVERSREAITAQLVQLTAANDRLQLELQELPRLRITCQDLDQRCNALLQMYGEKVEETNELRMDLQDVKEMYKNQIDILVAKSSHR